MNKFARFASVKKAALGTAILAASASAMAAVDPAVNTAIDGAKADLVSTISYIIAAMVVVWGVRKLGQKMGWL